MNNSVNNSVASQTSLFQLDLTKEVVQKSAHTQDGVRPPKEKITEPKRQVPEKNSTETNVKELPPMLRHYLEVKAQHPDRLVFYQVGDFFEVFFDDAVVVSNSLSIRLTSRDKDQENPIPMCGVPIHAFKNYSSRLLKSGFGCVVVEQTEDAAQAKGLVKRAITQILTPGVSFEGDSTELDEVNYIISLCLRTDSTYAACIMEASTGKVILHDKLESKDLTSLISRYLPREILLDAFNSSEIQAELSSVLNGYLTYSLRFSTYDFSKVNEHDVKSTLILSANRQLELNLIHERCSKELLSSFYSLLSYVTYVSQSERILLSHIQADLPSQSLLMDGATIKNLELLSSSEGSKEFSLFGVLDKSRTALGSRQVKEWLLSPSTDMALLELRFDQIAGLLESQSLLESIRKDLYEIRDLERLCTKLISGRASPYDLGLLLKSLKVVPPISKKLSEVKNAFSFKELLSGFDGVPDLSQILDAALLEDLPVRLGEGPIFKESYNEELLRLRQLESGSIKIINNLEQSEKNRAKISNLKIKHNSVLGYFIEIGINHSSKAPEDYIKKQTLSNVERFFTTELKDLEKEIYAATNKISSLEKKLFLDLKNICLNFLTEIQELGKKVGYLDAICAFAAVSKDNAYVRPKITAEIVTEIIKGRHPVVEKSIGRAKFVPNDLRLRGDGKRFAVLTGPNMGGKSTYLRQIGIIQILAQAGCFVPAESATLGVVDRIFTRIGAGDSLARGDSTFMVEMKEAASIVLSATNRSLVLVDELGRGTATKDGYSLALAIAEWLISKAQARTIFATHFHELNLLEHEFETVQCLSVGIIETLSRIEFTHKIEMRAAEKSYGIHVARLAGIPAEIVSRAHEIVTQMPEDLLFSNAISSEIVGEKNQVLSYEQEKLQSYIEVISQINPDTFSPKEALDLIYEMVKQAKELRPSE